MRGRGAVWTGAHGGARYSLRAALRGRVNCQQHFHSSLVLNLVVLAGTLCSEPPSAGCLGSPGPCTPLPLGRVNDIQGRPPETKPGPPAPAPREPKHFPMGVRGRNLDLVRGSPPRPFLSRLTQPCACRLYPGPQAGTPREPGDHPLEPGRPSLGLPEEWGEGW